MTREYVVRRLAQGVDRAEFRYEASRKWGKCCVWRTDVSRGTIGLVARASTWQGALTQGFQEVA